jgi:hypothetical protein
VVQEWGRRAANWQEPAQLIEAMVGLSRMRSGNGPLYVYLLLSEIDRGRSPGQRLAPQTVRLLAEKFPRFRQQYLIFSEFHTLDNAAITRFLDTAESLDVIRDVTLRANALGIFHATVGLWQILARQGQIPADRLNDSWQRVVTPFARSVSAPGLFEAGRTALQEMLREAAGSPVLTEASVVALLAGPEQSSPEGQAVRAEMGRRIRSILAAQRLVSLDTLFALWGWRRSFGSLRCRSRSLRHASGRSGAAAATRSATRRARCGPI